MKSIRLPKEPKDQHKIRCWTVFSSSRGPRIQKWVGVFHVNTPWKKLFPEEPNLGVDFINDWMLFQDNRFVSRISGWRGPIQNWPWKDLYPTQKEALLEAIKRCEGDIVWEKQRLKETQKTLSDLKKRL